MPNQLICLYMYTEIISHLNDHETINIPEFFVTGKTVKVSKIASSTRILTLF